MSKTELAASELADYIERYHNHDPKLICAATEMRRLETELRLRDEWLNRYVISIDAEINAAVSGTEEYAALYRTERAIGSVRTANGRIHAELDDSTGR